VFCYGQTGSGKTHTMGTASNDAVLERDWGVIPRAIRHIFRLSDERAVQAATTVRCAFLEIVNEEARTPTHTHFRTHITHCPLTHSHPPLPATSHQVRDLLHPDTPSKSISIRERGDGMILVSGIREERCGSAEELERALERGALSRTTGATRMNAASSRSHAIFTVIVEQRRKAPRPGEPAYVSAKFHMVDLAGSERNKKTEAVGTRFKEAVHINGGLLVLGNVINALGDAARRGGGVHIPYRDSKLTRMLQDSLGGNSRTCMIACVSTADSNLEETLNTLKYADRARAIRNRPTVNVDPNAAALAAVREEPVYDDGGVGGGGGPGGGGGGFAGERAAAAEVLAAVRAQQAEAEAEVAALKASLAAAKASADAAAEELLQVRAERDVAQMELADTTAALEVAAAANAAGGGNAEVAAAFLARASSTIGSVSADGTLSAGGEAAGAMKAHLRKLADVEARLAGKEAALQRCEALLAEAQADLARDELIFRDKLNDAKALKKALKEALADADAARAEAAAAQAALAAARARGPSYDAATCVTLADWVGPGGGISGGASDAPSGGDAATPTTPATAGFAAAREGRNGAGTPPPPALSLTPVGESESASASASSLPSADGDDEVLCFAPTPRGTGAGGAGAGAGAAGSRRGSMENLRAAASLPEDASSLSSSVSGETVEQLERALADKEAERAALLAEKARAEEAKARAEEDAERDAAEHARSSQAMSRQLRELEYSISRKEELIQDLARNEEEARALSARYEARMRALEAEVQRRETEAEELRSALGTIDATAAKSSEEAARTRAEYEARLLEAQAQLEALKERQREQASGASGAKASARGEAKVSALEAELSRMRAAGDALKRRIAAAAEAAASEAAGVARDMASLKKDAEASQKRIRELEAENGRQRAVLQKRADEMLAAQRKLKEARGGGGSGSALGAPAGAPAEPAWWPGAGGPPGAAGTPPPPPHSASPLRASVAGGVSAPKVASNAGVRRSSGAAIQVPRRATDGGASPIPGASAGGAAPPPREWLQADLAKLLRGHEAEEEAASAAAKHAAVTAERDAVAAEKAALDLRRERAAAALEEALKTVTATIWEDETQMAALEGPAAEGDADAAAALAKLHAAHSVSYRDRAALEARRRGEEWLSPAEEAAARALGDRLESLETAAQYCAASAAEARREADDAAAAAGAFREHAAGLGGPDARAALSDVVAAAVVAAAAARRDAQRATSAEATLADRERELSEATSALARRELDYDRRVVELQKEHARKVQVLLQQAAAVTSLAGGGSSGASPGAGGDATPPAPPPPGWRPTTAAGTTAVAAAAAAAASSPDPMSSPARPASAGRASMGFSPSPPAAPSSAPGGGLVSLHSSLAADAAAFRQEQLKALDRDVRYFKQSNKELKRKLREASAEREELASEREAALAQRDATEQLVATLMEELAQHKAAWRHSHGAGAGGVATNVSASMPSGSVLPPPPPWLANQAEPGGGPVRVSRPAGRQSSGGDAAAAARVRASAAAALNGGAGCGDALAAAASAASSPGLPPRPPAAADARR
jgi:hypothetical protein